MTLAELRTRVRYLLGEPSTTVNHFWTNDEINAWLNEGYVDFCEKTGTLQEVYLQGFTAGQQESALPSNFIALHGMEWVDGDGNVTVLYPEYRVDLNRSASNTGTPQYYYLRSFNVYGLVPIPNEAGTVRLYLSITPLTLLSSDSDVPALERRYHYALIYYATYLAKLKKKSDDAEIFKARYEEQVLKAVSQSEGRVDGQPIRIIPDMGYYRG